MQREGWGRCWGKETEREGASDGKRDAVAREQLPHRGPQNTGQRNSSSFLLNLSLRSDAEGTQKYSSRNKRDGDGWAELLLKKFCVCEYRRVRLRGYSGRPVFSPQRCPKAEEKKKQEGGIQHRGPPCL